MNAYSILKFSRKIKNPRINLSGIFAFHILKKRYLGIFIDPVLACNLQCQMCYFSDENYRKNRSKDIINIEKLEKISNAFFHRALKLQIGCAAEPTVYKNLPLIIKLGKEKAVPYISLTTNANLLSNDLLEQCLSAGLDEITISLHGVYKNTYEKFMKNANYEKFISALESMSEAKKKYNFKLRINYTFNADNFEELKDFFSVYKDINIDILQLRPITKQGDTAYSNFEYDEIINKYDDVLLKVKTEAIERNIICIAPLKTQLIKSEGDSFDSDITNSTYCYISPNYAWRKDFDLNNDTFESYSKRVGTSSQLFKNIFKKKVIFDGKKKQLNYTID